jgi:hypothetical protein
MSRRFPVLSRHARYVSAGETITALIWMLVGIIILLIVVWIGSII